MFQHFCLVFLFYFHTDIYRSFVEQTFQHALLFTVGGLDSISYIFQSQLRYIKEIKISFHVTAFLVIWVQSYNNAALLIKVLNIKLIQTLGIFYYRSVNVIFPVLFIYFIILCLAFVLHIINEKGGVNSRPLDILWPSPIQHKLWHFRKLNTKLQLYIIGVFLLGVGRRKNINTSMIFLGGNPNWLLLSRLTSSKTEMKYIHSHSARFLGGLW